MAKLNIALHKSLIVITLVLAMSSSLAQNQNSVPQYFPMPSASGTPLPFSEAVLVGETLYVSGQIGITPRTMSLVAGGIGPESRRALENIQAILERHGASMDNVVKCTVFLADIKDWSAFNEVYREFFKANLPARSALAASGLALNARVEVECIAHIPASSKSR